MQSKLRQLAGKHLVTIFERFGYNIKKQTGSHIKMTRTDSRIIIIPNHNVIDKGTLKAIYKQALVIIPENELKKYFYTNSK